MRTHTSSAGTPFPYIAGAHCPPPIYGRRSPPFPYTAGAHRPFHIRQVLLSDGLGLHFLDSPHLDAVTAAQHARMDMQLGRLPAGSKSASQGVTQCVKDWLAVGSSHPLRRLVDVSSDAFAARYSKVREAAVAMERGRSESAEELDQARELREIREGSCFSNKSDVENLATEMWEDKQRPLEESVKEVQKLTSVLWETVQWMLPNLTGLDDSERERLKTLMSEVVFMAVA